MNVPYDLDDINEEVLDIKIFSVDTENTLKRHFTWHVSHYNSTNCTIQILWERPPWISSTLVRDKLYFKVLDREKFLDPKARQLRSSKQPSFISESNAWEIEVPP